MKIIEGTAKNMGIEIEKQNNKKIIVLFQFNKLMKGGDFNDNSELG